MSLTRRDTGLLILRLFVGFFTLYAGVQIIVSDHDFTREVSRLGAPLLSVAANLLILGHVGLELSSSSVSVPGQLDFCIWGVRAKTGTASTASNC